MTPGLRFDPYLDAIGSERMKQMARRWAGSKATRKANAHADLLAALRQPDRLSQVVASLEPYEQQALALVRAMGGRMEHHALGLGLVALGVPLPVQRYGWGRLRLSERLPELLLHDGLFLVDDMRSPDYLSDYSMQSLFCDERILAQAPPLAVPRLDWPHTVAAGATRFRRPPAVTLDLVGMLQAVQAMGGLVLTRSGTVRVGDTRRLLRTLAWDGNEGGPDNMPFPDAGPALAGALYESGLLVEEGNRLAPAQPSEAFAAQSYAQQVSGVLAGFLRLTNWQEAEYSTGHVYLRRVDVYPMAALRPILLILLAALPLDGDAFYSLGGLLAALRDILRRDQGDPSHTGGSAWPLGYASNAPQHSEARLQPHRAEAEQALALAIERFVRSALSSWLYFLGLVDLALDKEQIVGLRLTELGRAVLHPQAQAASQEAVNAGPAWVVQPTFDLVIYLERTTPLQLAFLERCAERVQAQQHIATYRLTRESVYRALEAGMTEKDLLEGLRAGAQRDLPQNVAVEIGAWAGLREQVVLHRQARLVEFGSRAEREAALRAGAQGKAVGDRFLLGPDSARHVKIADAIDYNAVQPRSLRVDEDGMVTLTGPVADLLLGPRLDGWSQRLADVRSVSVKGKTVQAERGALPSWWLNDESVRQALKAGGRINDLLSLLQERALNAVPPLLIIALRAWAGASYEHLLGSVAILQCSQPEVLQAVAHSPLLRPYLLAYLTPDILLVDGSKMESLKERLAMLGLQKAPGLHVQHLPALAKPTQ